jgi:hypothetical protein
MKLKNFNEYIILYNSKVKTLLNKTVLPLKIKNACESYLIEKINNDFNAYRQFEYPTSHSIDTWFNFRIKILDKIINLFLYPPSKDKYPYSDKYYPCLSNLQYIQGVASQYKNIVFYLLLFLLADTKYYNNFFTLNKQLKKLFDKNYNTINSMFKRPNMIGFDYKNQNIIKKYIKDNIDVNKRFYIKINNARHKLSVYFKFIGKLMTYYYYIIDIRYKPGGTGYFHAKENFYLD